MVAWRQQQDIFVGAITGCSGAAAEPRGLQGLRVGADPEEPLPRRRDARLGARRREAAARGGGGVQGRVGRVRHGERARALREGLAGPARVEERGGQRGGDPGAPRGELRGAAERRDRVARPRGRGARVAEHVVREGRCRVALREAGRRRRATAAVGQGADRGLGLLPECGGGVVPVRVGRRRRRRAHRGAGRLPAAALLALPAHWGVQVRGQCRRQGARRSAADGADHHARRRREAAASPHDSRV